MGDNLFLYLIWILVLGTVIAGAVVKGKTVNLVFLIVISCLLAAAIGALGYIVIDYLSIQANPPEGADFSGLGLAVGIIVFVPSILVLLVGEVISIIKFVRIKRRG